MPRKPKRPCGYPGCPRLTEKRYCKEHETLVNRQYDQYERSPDKSRIYGHGWKTVRDSYAKEHPLCERCLAEGRTTPMDEVHHILPVKKGGTHARENLMSLCRSCHNRIHIERGERRTDGG